ncbi:hypothetical protein WA026_006548 [Henosepilachna vigintioctopunctata]|uniref:Uncharacterized protein n=1 Tax=Henosepilachna vigintioctopunctata TaxID=420089 RepID=A0AAW1UJ94_9CUCU
MKNEVLPKTVAANSEKCAAETLLQSRKASQQVPLRIRVVFDNNARGKTLEICRLRAVITWCGKVSFSRILAADVDVATPRGDVGSGNLPLISSRIKISKHGDLVVSNSVRSNRYIYKIKEDFMSSSD